MASFNNIIQFTINVRESFRGPPHGHAGHGFASTPSLYRALQRLSLNILRMEAQAPGLGVEAVQTAALPEDAKNAKTPQAVLSDEVDEYSGRRAMLTHHGATSSSLSNAT